MNSIENFHNIEREDSPRISIGEFQSKMIDKFTSPSARFLPDDSVPHFVHEDLYRLGAVTQPVQGGRTVTWLDSKFLAEIRDRHEKLGVLNIGR